MLFNSIEFLVFFPTVCLIYTLLNKNQRGKFLILASYGFYMAWKPKYALIMILLTVLDFYFGIAIENAQLNNSSTRKTNSRIFLLGSIIANLSILFAFKYFNFFSEEMHSLLLSLGLDVQLKRLQLLLPVGISFHTYQAMAYNIDIYLGKQKAERSFEKFALFICFFPQMVAGPIERASKILPQFDLWNDLDEKSVLLGCRLMLWGFFKKIVIADNLSTFVDYAFANKGSYSGAVMLLAANMFAWQIYCDFSGYSDIARGAAKVLGINLSINFNKPYFSKNIGEFWNRWHISLSHWFRDYLYIPLGGNRKGHLFWIKNILLVFVLSGLWHGANWTFVAWGLCHALFYFLERLMLKIAGLLGFTKSNTETVSRKFAPFAWLRMFYVYCLVTIAWVFFRAQNLSEAFNVLGKIFNRQIIRDLYQHHLLHQFKVFCMAATGNSIVYWTLFSMLVLIFIEVARKDMDFDQWLTGKTKLVRWCWYFGLFYACLFLGNISDRQFIYFQF